MVVSLYKYDIWMRWYMKLINGFALNRLKYKKCKELLFIEVLVGPHKQSW